MSRDCKGDWLQFGGDRYLTATSSLNGSVTQPRILWSRRLAARETLFRVTARPGQLSEITVPDTDFGPSSEEEVLNAWEMNGRLFDLDEAGSPTPGPSYGNTKIGKLIADRPGLQRFTAGCSTGFTFPYRKLEVRSECEWVELWNHPMDTTVLTVNPIFGDFDQDGRVEIACTPWHWLSLFDPATGELKERCRFIEEDEIADVGGRAYGYFGAHDVDGCGKDEFVVICDFAKHLSVSGWRNGRLERYWIRDITDPEKDHNAKYDIVMRVDPNPVADVDGDGVMEIAVSIYNLARDRRWHVHVYDGLTGAEKYNLPDTFLSGLHDLNSDGVTELLCTSVPDRSMHIPNPGEISVVSIRGGAPITLARLSGCGFECPDIPGFADNVSNSAQMGRATALCGSMAFGKTPVFVTRRPAGGGDDCDRLDWWRVAGEGVERVGSITGPRLRALRIRENADEAGELLVSSDHFAGESAVMECTDCRASALLSRERPAPLVPVSAVCFDGDASPTVIAETRCEMIEAFSIAPGGDTALRWRVPGTGMSRAHIYPTDGILLADVDGQGKLNVIVRRRGDGGSARLSVLDADGKELRHFDWPGIPGGHPIWNQPGLWFWQAAHFLDTARQDILLQFREGTVHGRLIDSRDGREVWRQTHTGSTEFFGGALVRPYLNEETGLDDIMAPNALFHTYEGATGRPIVSREVGELFGDRRQWGTFVTPLIGDFIGDGSRQVLFCNWEGLVLMTMEGEIIWDISSATDWNDWSDWTCPPVVTDIDGDGCTELLSFITVYGEDKKPCNYELRCRDAATGTLRWSLGPYPDLPTAPAVCDVDGDGLPELITTVGTDLYAFGSRPGGEGAVEWTLRLPARAGRVAVAGIAGSGDAGIAVMCDDGVIYGIG